MKKGIIFVVCGLLVFTSGCSSENEDNGSSSENAVVNQTQVEGEEESQVKKEDVDEAQIKVLKGHDVNSYVELPFFDPYDSSNEIDARYQSGGLKMRFNCFTIGKFEDEEELLEIVNGDAIIETLKRKIERYLDADAFLDVMEYQDEFVSINSSEEVSLSEFDANILSGTFNMINDRDENVAVPFYGYAINFNNKPVLYMVYDLEKSNVEKGKPVLDDMMLTFREWRDTDSE